MNINISDENALSAGAFLVGALIYAIRYITEKRGKNPAETQLENNAIKVDTSKTDYIEELRNDNRKLREDIDRIARERNDALAEVGGLRSELATYKSQCERKALLLDRCPVLNGGCRSSDDG